LARDRAAAEVDGRAVEGAEHIDITGAIDRHGAARLDRLAPAVADPDRPSGRTAAAAERLDLAGAQRVPGGRAAIRVDRTHAGLHRRQHAAGRARGRAAIGRVAAATAERLDLAHADAVPGGRAAVRIDRAHAGL